MIQPESKISATILIVDDEPNIRKLLRMYLEQDGFSVIEVTDGIGALREIESDPAPDFLILDLMLPELDGLEICKRVRASERSGLPILMLTARDEDVDKIVGLEIGADDYVTKPFNPREVVARVKAILRRAASDSAQYGDSVLRLGDVELNPKKRTVVVAGAQADLRRLEFDLLEAFLRQPEIVLGRGRLLDQVWGYEYLGKTRTVDAHVASLRRILQASEVRIETVTGVGYRITSSD